MREKDQSEIDGILQVFPDAFLDKYGKPLKFEVLVKYLDELLVRREMELIESALGGLSAKSIRLMLETIESKTKLDSLAIGNDLGKELVVKTKKKRI